MQNSTTSAQNSTLPQSLHFPWVKTFHFQVKEMERYPLRFSILTDVPTASNQTLHMAILMQFRRPGGIPGISQKFFFPAWTQTESPKTSMAICSICAKGNTRADFK